jgi:anti-sigma factor RsiW
MYEDGKRTRLSCYYLPVEGGGETEFQYREQNGVGAFYWVDDGLAYAIAATTTAACCSRSRRSSTSNTQRMATSPK